LTNKNPIKAWKIHCHLLINCRQTLLLARYWQMYVMWHQSHSLKGSLDSPLIFGFAKFHSITHRDAKNAQSHSHKDHDVDQQPSTITVASNIAQPAVPSAVVVEQPVEDSNSSESTSVTSNIPTSDADAKPARHDMLEALIKDDVLRYDPEVADLFYERIKGTLEYALPEHIEQPQGSHELSLLHLLELEAIGLVQPCGGATEYAGSLATGTSSSPSATSSGQALAQSSSPGNNKSGTGSSAPAKDRASTNEGSSQQTKRQKINPKSITSQSSKARAFRCFFNALYPSIFSVNQETLEKFRTCTGPGWSSMQHVR
jgi:hypothetical protein